MSAQQKKIAFVATIAVLLIGGFLITSVASFRASRSQLRSEILHNELPMTGDNIYSEIQRDLITPIMISSLMAHDIFLRDWILDGEKDPKLITRYLKEIEQSYGVHSSFFVSEKTRTYYHTDGILKKVSPEEPRDKWYYRVREMRELYEINTDPDLANKDLITIFINHRVLDYNGNFIGAIGVGLTERAVLDLIEIYQAKYDRTVYFFDKNGNVTLAGSKFDPVTASVNNLDKLPPDHEKELSLSYKADGQTIHANIRYIEEWDWFLAVEQNDEKVLRGISQVLLMSIIICALMTGIITLMVNASINRYQRRIAVLNGIIHVCVRCNKVRDPDGTWHDIKTFISRHTDAEFSHSICPDCMKDETPDTGKA